MTLGAGRDFLTPKALAIREKIGKSGLFTIKNFCSLKCIKIFYFFKCFH